MIHFSLYQSFFVSFKGVWRCERPYLIHISTLRPRVPSCHVGWFRPSVEEHFHEFFNRTRWLAADVLHGQMVHKVDKLTYLLSSNKIHLKLKILNSSFGAKSADVDAEVNRLLYEPSKTRPIGMSGADRPPLGPSVIGGADRPPLEPSNKHLCKTRLITVPEPSEPDEDSHGYTRLLDPAKSEKIEIQDSVCHVWH